MSQFKIRQRDVEHLRNMDRLDEEDRSHLERLAARWAAERDQDDQVLPAGVIPLRPRAA